MIIIRDSYPPAAYPALLDASENDVDFILTIPDLGLSLRTTGFFAARDGAVAVRRALRERAAKGWPAPFPSKADALAGDGSLVMLPTDGWDRIEDEEVPE